MTLQIQGHQNNKISNFMTLTLKINSRSPKVTKTQFPSLVLPDKVGKNLQSGIGLFKLTAKHKMLNPIPINPPPLPGWSNYVVSFQIPRKQAHFTQTSKSFCLPYLFLCLAYFQALNFIYPMLRSILRQFHKIKVLTTDYRNFPKIPLRFPTDRYKQANSVDPDQTP